MSFLEGKTIWLTGASSGIGEALAERLSRINCRIAISARREAALEDLARRCGGSPGRVLAIPLDVTDRNATAQAYARIRAELGPVDILITCAGTYLPMDAEQFDAVEHGRIMDLNYKGTLNTVEAVLPGMIERRSGLLVPVASLVGYRGLPRSCSYGASKAALINFFEGLRFDLLRHQVRVTIVNPGFVKTPLTDQNDFDMPFLVDAAASAEEIVRGIERGKFEIHYPWRLSWIFKLLRIIPYPLYHALIASKVVRK